MKLLITGTAGFIGFHLAQDLLSKGHSIVGVDNLNSYYDVKLKLKRNAILKKNKNYKFYIFELYKIRLVNTFGDICTTL